MIIETLTDTQRRMIAASLEIDGRADRAAEAVIGGHIMEFVYTGEGQPVSPKAIKLEALKAEIEARNV